MNGFIKIHRKLPESKVWNYTEGQFKVFMAILLHCNWREEWGRFNGKEVKIKPGQLPTSREHLSRVSGMGGNTVRRTLEKLERDDIIETKRTSRGTLITVLNWGKYQGTEDTPTSQGYNRGYNQGYNQGYTHKEVQEEEEVKEENHIYRDESKKEENEGLKEIYDYWNKKGAGIKHRKFSPHKSSINARLEDGFTKEEIKQAIDNLALALNSDDYYWSHKWTLKEFLSRQEGAKVEQFLQNVDQFRKDDGNYGGGQTIASQANRGGNGGGSVNRSNGETQGEGGIGFRADDDVPF